MSEQLKIPKDQGQATNMNIPRKRFLNSPFVMLKKVIKQFRPFRKSTFRNHSDQIEHEITDHKTSLKIDNSIKHLQIDILFPPILCDFKTLMVFYLFNYIASSFAGCNFRFTKRYKK